MEEGESAQSGEMEFSPDDEATPRVEDY